MAGASIRLEGYDETLAALEGALDRTQHKQALFENVGALLLVSTQQRFESETDPEGNPWPPSIRALAEGGRTLTDSAALVNSQTYLADDESVEVGTDMIYAAIHQLGGTIRPVVADKLVFTIGGQFVSVDEVTIPKRSFLGIDDDDEAGIIDLAETWVDPEYVEGANA